jgi:SAM-dependent methyltransferase
MTTYLLSDQPTEAERLRLQSLVWEEAGRVLLAGLPGPRPQRVVDLGCGCLGWLRVLSEHVGPEGEVVGTDIDRKLLALAQEFVDAEGLKNVTLVEDDIFASSLEPASFELVHARFQIAPLGQGDRIVSTMRSLVADGGRVVLEDPDSISWRFNPQAPAAESLARLVVNAFRRSGGDFDAGRTDPDRLRSAGLEVVVRTEVLALGPGHPYLRLPLQFSEALADRIGSIVDPAELARLRAAATVELADSDRWGTTFTVVQAVGTAPTAAPAAAHTDG